MGTCREGYNLFTKGGWKHLFKNWKYNKLDYVWEDTFGKFICRIIGHGKTFNTDDIPPEKCCLRCFKIISPNKT